RARKASQRSRLADRITPRAQLINTRAAAVKLKNIVLARSKRKPGIPTKIAPTRPPTRPTREAHTGPCAANEYNAASTAKSAGTNKKTPAIQCSNATAKTRAADHTA